LFLTFISNAIAKRRAKHDPEGICEAAHEVPAKLIALVDSSPETKINY
jgi:hypothetical protein